MQLTHWPGKRVCLCLVEVTTGQSRRQGAHGTVQCDVQHNIFNTKVSDTYKPLHDMPINQTDCVNGISAIRLIFIINIIRLWHVWIVSYLIISIKDFFEGKYIRINFNFHFC